MLLRNTTVPKYVRHSWRTARTLGYDVELGRVNNRNQACWRDPSKEQYLFVGSQTGLFRPGKQVMVA